MSANTLNIAPSFAQAKVALHGDMDVTFNTSLANDFIISFFSSTNEIFTFTSTLYKFRDFAGNLVSTIVFGGKQGLFIELTLDATTGVLYPTANNIVATGSERTPIRIKEINVNETFEDLDGSQADIFKIKLANATTLTLPAIKNPVEGFEYKFLVQQDDVGNRKISFTSKYKFPGGRAPVMSILPNMIDLFKVTPSGTVFLCEGIIGYSTTAVAAIGDVKYDMISSAISAVKNDETIWLLRTGNMAEALASNQVDKSFAIAGMPSVMPGLIVDSTIRLSFGKAIINPESGELYMRDLTMSGAADPEGGNGAAVRGNPNTRYMQFDNVKMSKNENGILTSPFNPAFRGARGVFNIVLQDSEFNNNGYSTNHQGRTHNIYIGERVRIFSLRCKFLNSEFGHDYKSRADQNQLERCRLEGSKSGRALDIPNGGVVHATNCYFRKPSGALQSNLIGIGQEGIVDREQQYIFRNCLFENLRSTNFQLSFVNQANSTVKVYFVDCVFLGNTESIFNVGPVEYIYTGGHLGPDDYFGPAGFIPKVGTLPTAGASIYTPIADQPVPINGPDPTLEWYPPLNPPSVNPSSPAPAPVMVLTTSTRNYPGTDSGAGGGVLPPPPPDVTPPVISVVTSETEVTVRGPVSIIAQASDNTAVKKVEFFRNNVLITTVTKAPYTVIDYITSEYNGEVSYTAKAYDLADNSTISSAAKLGVAIIETAPSALHPFSIDAVTQAEYNAAINAASMGAKRAAGAQAIINAMSSNYRINIYADNTLVVPIDYTSKLTLVNDGAHVYVKAGTPELIKVLASKKLIEGVWRFELQGGVGYNRKIIGSVGDPASGALLILNENPEVTSGLTVNFALQLPASLDVAQ